MGSIWHWPGFMGAGVIGGWPSCNWVLELEQQHRVSHKTMMLSMPSGSLARCSLGEDSGSRFGDRRGMESIGFHHLWRFIRSVYFARGKRLAGCQTADMQ
ncbi:unnamed protein product [[Candida] boidinii]|nr:unnamed protein product [[Candida] boidinii]